MLSDLLTREPDNKELQKSQAELSRSSGTKAGPATSFQILS